MRAPPTADAGKRAQVHEPETGNRPNYDQPIERMRRADAHWCEADYLAKRVMLADLKASRQFARGRLLDVGCGNKPYADLFGPYVQSYIGVDSDPHHSRPDVAADVLHLPFAPATFDTILATQVLEHVPHPDHMLEELSRILKPSGHLILTAPQYWPLHEVPHDYYRFTQFGLRHLIHASGLIPLHIQREGTAWTLIGQALCNALRDRRGWHRLIPLINLLFGLLDRLCPDPRDTINYLVVARKPPLEDATRK